MHMTYWFGVDLGSFLFPGYNVTTIWGLLATCLGLAALAVLIEAMKISNIHLQQFKINRSYLKRTLQVLHWSLHTTFTYILMMAVMSYNVYITIAVVLGGCFGYWLFGLTLVQYNMEHFRKKTIMCDKDCEDVYRNDEQRRVSSDSSVAEQLVSQVNIEVHSPDTQEL